MVLGKVALVTGSAGGIAVAVTRLLLQNGAKVSMLDIDEAKGQSSCDELRREFSDESVAFIQCDVSNEQMLVSAFEETKRRFGRIDIVINNAGSVDEDEWEALIKVNLTALIRSSYLARDCMSTKNGGRGGVVINTASIGAFQSTPFLPVYCATKHATLAFCAGNVKKYSEEGILLHCVCPGAVDTDMFRGLVAKGIISQEELRHLEPVMSADELAKVYLRLCKDAQAGEVVVSTKESTYSLTLPDDYKKALDMYKQYSDSVTQEK